MQLLREKSKCPPKRCGTFSFWSRSLDWSAVSHLVYPNLNRSSWRVGGGQCHWWRCRWCRDDQEEIVDQFAAGICSRVLRLPMPQVPETNDGRCCSYSATDSATDLLRFRPESDERGLQSPPRDDHPIGQSNDCRSASRTICSSSIHVCVCGYEPKTTFGSPSSG